MRAGSLSSKDVISKLKRNFVCVWDNTEGESNAGGSFAHPPSDPAPQCIRGNGEHNVQTLFLTPDRKLLHTVAGFVSGPELVQELNFVENLWELVKRAQTESAKKYLITNAHKQALREADKRTFTGPLADWAKRRVRSDHAFAQRNPLLPAASYRSEDHVGKSTSWFGSSSGGRPKGSIGTPRHPGPEADRPRDKSGPNSSAQDMTPEMLEWVLKSDDIPEHLKEVLREKFGKSKSSD